MQPPRGEYWDDALGRLVRPDEPCWDADRFAEKIALGSAPDRDTIPAPPPVPEEHP